MSNLALSNIIERKPFKLCKLDYDDIMEEMSRRDVIKYDIDIDNEEEFNVVKCDIVDDQKGMIMN